MTFCNWHFRFQTSFFYSVDIYRLGLIKLSRLFLTSLTWKWYLPPLRYNLFTLWKYFPVEVSKGTLFLLLKHEPFKGFSYHSVGKWEWSAFVTLNILSYFHQTWSDCRLTLYFVWKSTIEKKKKNQLFERQR